MPGLSQVNLLDALKNRRCYSTNDANCELSFTINGTLMGDYADPTADTLKINIAVKDPDESDQISKIELIQNGKVMKTVEPKVTDYIWDFALPAQDKSYLYVKATQADGDLIFSAPIWLEAEATE